MADDNLREALQGMRQPQPGIVYIADVLAHVEPELEYARERLRYGREAMDRNDNFINELCMLIPDERDDDVAAEAIVIDWVKELLADRDRARDAAVALEQENAAARALHAERVITEHDHETSRDTERTWSICIGCSSRDIIDALDDGELIEEYEGAPWPCATYAALSGGERS